MKRARKVVLAYSGGVDTTACIPYLKHEWGCEEVVALTADLGQGAELGPIRDKALKAGASEAVVVDAREVFVTDYAFPALRANALYEDRYPLSSALGRPLIARMLVETARARNCDAVAHGCTGKGNDQVRFDLAVSVLDPELTVLAPAREWGMSRAETIAYSEAHGIPGHVRKSAPYAIDLNILGRNVEAGPLEDLRQEPPEEVYALTRTPEEAPDKPQYITIEFDEGIPTAIDGKQMPPVAMFEKLNVIAGAHGIGRLDILENRVVGIKTREVYEAPAQVVLILAHRELESLTLTAEVLRFKRGVESAYSSLVYDGLWYSPLKQALEAFVDQTQETGTGRVRLKLYKGTATVAGLESPFSLYRYDLATYGPECIFAQDSAAGFIDIFGLSTRVWSQMRNASGNRAAPRPIIEAVDKAERQALS